MVRLFHSAFLLVPILLFSCVRDQGVPELLQAVPVNALVVAEVNDVSEVLEKGTTNRFWEQLDTTAYLKTVCAKGRQLWLELHDGETPETVGPVVLSWHDSGANSYDLLLVLDQSGHPYLPEWYSRWSQSGARSARGYDGQTIMRFDLPKSGKSFFAARVKGLVLASESDLLVEDALRQLRAKVHLLNDPVFSRLHRMANRKDAVNLYFQYEPLGKWARERMKAGSFEWLERGAQWTELDLAFKSDRLIANGLTQVSDSVVNYLSLFRKNPARRNQLLNLLPNNTAAVAAISLENFASYQRDYEKLLRQLNRSDDLLDLKDQSARYKAYTSWVDTEFGIALLENPGADWEKSSVGLIKFRDKRLAEEALGTQAASEVIKYNDFAIRQIGNSAFATVFGRIFKTMEECYYTTYRDYVVIAPDELIIKQFLNDNRNGRTLNDDAAFTSLREELSAKSHVFFYAENPQALSLLQAVTRPEYAEGLTARKEEWNGIAAIGWQMVMEENAAHTQLIVRYRTEEQAETRLRWATELDTAAGYAPVIVKDHYSKQYEVLVQDVANILYLINAKGDIVWRRQLSEPITSEIHQIDRYRNGKLQFVFNTPNRLYMLDRNGKDVEDFPIDLPSEVTAQVNVFDYDHNRNYRLLLACGQRILMLEADGKPVSGWEYPQAETEVIGKPRLYQISGKDYLVLFFADGHVTLRNRRGQERVPLKVRIDLRDPELFLIKGPTLGDSRLVGLSGSGQLTSIFFNGTVDMTDIGISETDAYLAYSKGHQIILENNKLRVSGPEANYSLESSDALDRKVIPFDIGPQLVLGLQSSRERTLWLISASGNPYTGFPVTGDLGIAIRDLDLDGNLDLITADREGYVCNYALD